MVFNVDFVLVNLYILPFWALMIFAPHWVWTQRICGSLWMLLPLAITYAVLLIVVFVQLSSSMPDINTAAGVVQMLNTPFAATVGWTHYLVFDLFVGRWAYLDSHERHISAWWVSPTLVFINLVGPLGFLLYLGVRWLHQRQRQAVT
jgi:hypothetical protein